MMQQKMHTMEAIPENAEKHLHKCPVESCGHEVILSPAPMGKRDGGANKWRQTVTPDGEIVRELLAVRAPNSCWCGAPLPGAQEVTFDLSEFEVQVPCTAVPLTEKPMEVSA